MADEQPMTMMNFRQHGAAWHIPAEPLPQCRPLKEANDALEDTARRLRAIARLARVGYWELDVAHDEVSWSPEACEVLGLPPNNRTRPWGDFERIVHAEDWPAVSEARARALRGDPLSQVAFRIVRTDGHQLSVESMAEAIRDKRGHVTRLVGAIQDVSDRRATEEVLHGSERRLQIALQATGLGPWDWDLTTNAVDFWPEWKRQLGYEPHEIANRYDEWESRLHPDDRDRVLTALRAYLGGRESEYSLEFRLRHKDGTYRWIYTRGVVSRDASGRPVRMTGGHLDITDRKRLEDQYRQSQKMQAIGQLAGGIAHDFNNLLTAIIGYADLVAKEMGTSHRLRRAVDQISAAATSAAALTRQLLAFSRRQILAPQVIDLDAVLHRMQHLLGRVIGENITLVMQPASAGYVIADPGQIEQVIVNLAVNARDAMPAGGRLLIATADVEIDGSGLPEHPGANAGPHVMIVVSDTGVGMDEATRAHLFEPFFTTKPDGRGTGLGLATVYGIVKQSGGSIWVDSEPGRGSTFRIYLPAAVVAAVPAAPEAPVDAAALRGTETVLVVEDQDGVRGVIEETLHRLGYTVVAAASGDEAMAAVRAHAGPIHLMLTDVVLPGASGREVARLVRAERETMRVLYMSGYTDEAIVQHGVLEPGLAFIQKPFTGATLTRRIREVLAADPAPLV